MRLSAEPKSNAWPGVAGMPHWLRQPRHAGRACHDASRSDPDPPRDTCLGAHYRCGQTPSVPKRTAREYAITRRPPSPNSPSAA